MPLNISDEDVVFIDNVYRGRYPAEAGLLPLGDPSEADAQKILGLADQIFNETQTSIKTPGSIIG